MTVEPTDFGDGRRDAVRADRIGDAEFAQRRDRIGGESHRKPNRPRRRGALEDPDLPAGATQRNPGCEAADARADDQSGRHAPDVGSRSGPRGVGE
jgi:hypothetical protein